MRFGRLEYPLKSVACACIGYTHGTKAPGGNSSWSAGGVQVDGSNYWGRRN
jgi:hypothetical protein